MSITAEVLEIVREMPGCTSADVLTLMPHVKKQTVYARLDMLKTRGDVRQERDEKKRVHWYMNETPKPIAPRRGGRKKPAVIELNNVSSQEAARRLSTSIGKKFLAADGSLQAIYDQIFVDNLKAKITELEAWKADAIQRYPDLAIPPLLKKAREIVAQELRDSGDTAQAERVVEGKADTTLPVRLVLKMLEGEVA